jgi:phosphoribosylformylglycinamidine (FGAM) synthase-like enzyme
MGMMQLYTFKPVAMLWKSASHGAKGAAMTNAASTITPEVVAAHGLGPEEYDKVLHALGREPNLVELGIFSVMWSEHCSYKSSRLHLKKLPTQALGHLRPR